MWKASPTAVYSDLDGMTALLDTASNVYYCLPGIGAFLWERLRDGAGVDQLCDAVTDRYDVSASVARGDIVALMGRLRDAGLIVAADG